MRAETILFICNIMLNSTVMNGWESHQILCVWTPSDRSLQAKPLAEEDVTEIYNNGGKKRKK